MIRDIIFYNNIIRHYTKLTYYYHYYSIGTHEYNKIRVPTYNTTLSINTLVLFS